MQHIRAIKDKSARHIMLGICHFCRAVSYHHRTQPVFEGLADHEGKEPVDIAYLGRLETL